jgi:hypothetical protein
MAESRPTPKMQSISTIAQIITCSIFLALPRVGYYDSANEATCRKNIRLPKYRTWFDRTVNRIQQWENGPQYSSLVQESFSDSARLVV